MKKIAHHSQFVVLLGIIAGLVLVLLMWPEMRRPMADSQTTFNFDAGCALFGPSNGGTKDDCAKKSWEIKKIPCKVVNDGGSWKCKGQVCADFEYQKEVTYNSQRYFVWRCTQTLVNDGACEKGRGAALSCECAEPESNPGLDINDDGKIGGNPLIPFSSWSAIEKEEPYQFCTQFGEF